MMYVTFINCTIRHVNNGWLSMSFLFSCCFVLNTMGLSINTFQPRSTAIGSSPLTHENPSLLLLGLPLITDHNIRTFMINLLPLTNCNYHYPRSSVASCNCYTTSYELPTNTSHHLRLIYHHSSRRITKCDWSLTSSNS